MAKRVRTGKGRPVPSEAARAAPGSPDQQGRPVPKQITPSPRLGPAWAPPAPRAEGGGVMCRGGSCQVAGSQAGRAVMSGEGSGPAGGGPGAAPTRASRLQLLSCLPLISRVPSLPPQRNAGPASSSWRLPPSSSHAPLPTTISQGSASIAESRRGHPIG